MNNIHKHGRENMHTHTQTNNSNMRYITNALHFRLENDKQFKEWC